MEAPSLEDLVRIEGSLSRLQAAVVADPSLDVSALALGEIDRCPSELRALLASGIVQIAEGVSWPHADRVRGDLTRYSDAEKDAKLILALPGDDGRGAARFRIEERLGTGSYASVYRATRIEASSEVPALTEVALKVMRTELAGFDPIDEAKLGKDLGACPHVVRTFAVHHIGVVPVVENEFCAGGTLADRLRSGPVAPDEAARILAQVGEGLAFLHRKRFIHFDLKPANILLALEPADSLGRAPRERWKIGDLGLAQPLDEVHYETLLRGTAAYRSPEQLPAATPPAPGTDIDVWAIGVILHELLTGKLPFDPADVHTLSDAIRRGNVTRLAAVAPDREIPAALERLCLRCLETRRARRPSAREFVDELTSWLARSDDVPPHDRGFPSLPQASEIEGLRRPWTEPDLQEPEQNYLETNVRFVGREAPRKDLTRWALEGQPPAPVYCLIALGGCGKSRLAWTWFNEVLPEIRARGFSGAMWYNLYTPNFELSDLVKRALRYVNGRDSILHGGRETEINDLDYPEAADLLLEILDTSPYLLVLDGLERKMVGYVKEGTKGDEDPDDDLPSRAKCYLLERDIRGTDREFLMGLARLARSRVLVTSRVIPADLEEDDIGARGEPIRGVHFERLKDLSPDDARDLWRAVSPDDGMSDDEVKRLVESFGCHAQCTQIFAAAIHNAGGFEAWKSWNKDFDIFEEKNLKMKQRQSGILHFAMRKLSVKCLLILLHLHSVKETVTLDNLRRRLLNDRSPIANDEELRDILTDLWSRQIIGKDPTGRRYDLHPVVHGYIWSLQKKGDTGAHDNFDAAVSALSAMPREGNLDIGDMANLQPLIKIYMDCCTRGEKDGSTRSDFDEAWKTFHQKLYEPISRVNAGDRDLLDWLLRLFPDEDPSGSLPRLTCRSDQADALRTLAILLNQSGQGELADACSRRAGAIYFQQGEYSQFLDCRCGRAWRPLYLGRLFHCEMEFLLLIHEASIRRVPEVRFMARLWLRIVHAVMGQGREMLRLYAERAEILPPDNHRRWTFQCIAEAMLYVGDFEQAVRTVRLGVQGVDRPSDDSGQYIWELVTEGIALTELGRHDEAYRKLDKALVQATTKSYLIVECFALAHLARLELRRGRHSAAETWIEKYRKSDHDLAFPYPACEVLLAEAEIALHYGRHDAAEHAARKAFRKAECDGAPYVYALGIERARALLADPRLAGSTTDLPFGSRMEEGWDERRREILELLYADDSAPPADQSHLPLPDAVDEDDAPAEAGLVADYVRLRAKLRPESAGEPVRSWWAELEKDGPETWVAHIAGEIVSRGLSLEAVHSEFVVMERPDLDLILMRAELGRLRRSGSGDATSLPSSWHERAGGQSSGEPFLLVKNWLATRTGDKTKRAYLDGLARHDHDKRARPKEYGAFLDTSGDYHAFLSDARPRLRIEDAPEATRAWWRNFQMTHSGKPEVILSLADAIIERQTTLGQFLPPDLIGHPRGIEIACLLSDIERVEKTAPLKSISATDAWPLSRALIRLEKVKWFLGWRTATPRARTWWQAFEKENSSRMKLVLRLAEELAIRDATITDFFEAYVYSQVENFQANLHYLDYRRVKASEEQSRRLRAARTEWEDFVSATPPTKVEGEADQSDEQIAERYRKVRELLDWAATSGPARRWWKSFEARNVDHMPQVLRLSEVLFARRATITEFFLAYVYSNTDNLQANLHYLDYTRLKKEQERKKKEECEDARRKELAEEYPANRVRLGLDKSTVRIQRWWRAFEREYEAEPHLMHEAAKDLAKSGMEISEIYEIAQAEIVDQLPALVECVRSEFARREREAQEAQWADIKRSLGDPQEAGRIDPLMDAKFMALGSNGDVDPLAEYLKELEELIPDGPDHRPDSSTPQEIAFSPGQTLPVQAERSIDSARVEDIFCCACWNRCNGGNWPIRSLSRDVCLPCLMRWIEAPGLEAAGGSASSRACISCLNTASEPMVETPFGPFCAACSLQAMDKSVAGGNLSACSIDDAIQAHEIPGPLHRRLLSLASFDGVLNVVRAEAPEREGPLLVNLVGNLGFDPSHPLGQLVRQAAFEACIRAGMLVLPLLKDLCANRPETLAWQAYANALFAMGSIAPVDETVRAMLETGLTSANAHIRSYALEGIAARDSPWSREHLRAGLVDQDPDVRETAALLITKLDRRAAATAAADNAEDREDHGASR